MAKFCQKTGTNYEVPKLLETVTCILMEYVSMGTRLYSINPLTYTRCQEKYEKTDDQTVMGGFTAAGLDVRFNFCCGYDEYGISSLRRL